MKAKKSKVKSWKSEKMVGWSDNSDKEDERDIPVAGSYKSTWQSKVVRHYFHFYNQVLEQP